MHSTAKPIDMFTAVGSSSATSRGLVTIAYMIAPRCRYRKLSS